MKKFTMIKSNVGLIFIIVLLLGGCQPTPTREAVVNGGNLENEIASSSASAGTYDAPESWKETLDIEGSDATIDIDAAISVPDVTAYPVYKVSKADFDTAKVEKLVEYFAEGANVIKNKVQTKAELEENLVLAKKDNDEEWAAELEDMIETAPVTIPDEIIADWDPANKPSGSFLDESGIRESIGVMPDYFSYAKGYAMPESMLLSIESENPDKQQEKFVIGDISISKEDAIAAAQQLLHEISIDDMAAEGTEKALLCKSFFDVYTDDDKPLSEGYFIKFVRNVDGISGIINDTLIFFMSDDFAYRAPLSPEEIQIYVNEAGEVQSFSWQHPMQIEEKINENVELMPFDDMKQRMHDMLTYISSHDKETKTVKRIELLMTIVDVKDHPKEAMLVPAWFVYYTETVNGMPDGTSWEQNYRLVLNAVDGGRVLEAPADFGPEMQQAIDQQIAQYQNNQ